MWEGVYKIKFNVCWGGVSIASNYSTFNSPTNHCSGVLIHHTRTIVTGAIVQYFGTNSAFNFPLASEHHHTGGAFYQLTVVDLISCSCSSPPFSSSNITVM